MHGGGGESNLNNSEKVIKKDIQKLLQKDPISRIVKSSYDKVANGRLVNLESKYSPQEKTHFDLVKNAAKDNMNLLKGLNRKDKEKKYIEDMTLLLGKPMNVKKNAETSIPKQFNLYQNYPNPFNPSTTIKFDLPKDANVTIKIYDIIGRVVATLVNNELKKAGSYDITWNASNYATGVYFYRIEAGSFVSSKKMVLLK